MENRLRCLFLIAFLSFSLNPSVAFSADEDEETEGLIEPQIERTEFNESIIDSEDFEVAFYFGMLSVEDFEVNPVTGLRFSYHVNEDFYVQLDYALSDAGETSFEVLSGGAPLLTSEEREINYYQINLGYNLFPGEAFVTDDSVQNSAFYVKGGIGTTEFAGDDRFTFSYGFGYRLLFADSFSVEAEFRDLVFNMDLFGEEKTTHNLEYLLALSWYF